MEIKYLKSYNTLLIVITICTSIVCALLAIFGVAMVYLGATGKSDITLFGNTFSSESVGVSSIFIGGVVIIMLLRRTLVSHDHVVNPIKSSDDRSKIIDSNLGKAIKRLYNVSTQLRDIILTIQRDAFEAITDRKAFDELKRKTTLNIQEVAETFKEDASVVCVEKELKELIEVSKVALLDLPFPEELDVRDEDWTGKAVNIGIGSIGNILRCGSPTSNIHRSVENEFQTRISGLKRRFSVWWEKHADFLHSATIKLQDSLFHASIKLSDSVSKKMT